jgi:hypothetical protein
MALLVLALMPACTPDGKPKWTVHPAAPAKATQGPPLTLTAIDLSDAVRPIEQTAGVQLAAAKNEWTSFVLQVGPRVPATKYSLRLGALRQASGASTIPPSAIEVYQVLAMPVDVNRAGYVRHTGQDAIRGELPRALLPMTVKNGEVDLSLLRDASRPTDRSAAAPPAEPVLLWVDVRVPADAPAGEYLAICEAMSNGQAVAKVPLKLKVHDFTLPNERHLQLVGRLRWEDLERLYPDRFETIRPRLMNRRDAAYTSAIKTLDTLVALAQRHRTAVVVPRLQPTVKWPVNEPPNIDWVDFDSLIGPWMSGEAFEDKIPAGFWPLPATDMLYQFLRKLQLDYWSLVATHFDQNDWLDRAPLWLEEEPPGRVIHADAAEYSRMAAESLALHQRLRVAVPLENDQLLVADPANPKPGQLEAASTGRLLAASPALVFSPPMRFWPEAAPKPVQYLRTDMPSLVPYVGAGGDERDVRLWAWLAYLRQAQFINFADALPSLTDPTEVADPNELIWFYPGEWFGLENPVPTIQLKWLRRAQQDYEYIWLARQRGDADRDTRINTLLMSQLISKPVEIQPGQSPDPAYALMSGTTSQDVWNEAQRLLTEMISLHEPGKPIDPARAHTLHIQTLRWAEPQERPLLMGRTAEWLVESEGAENWLRLKLGLDIYNASATTPAENLLGWSSAGAGWEMSAQPISVPSLAMYNVRRANIDARFNIDKITPAARRPLELTFTNGFNNRTASLQMVLPIATSDRHEGPLPIDGKIEDEWNEADLIQNGPLVKMLSRPSLQRQKLESAATSAKVYTTWAAGSFFVAFDLGGVSATNAGRARNFVDYQFRRAWSEDLCEILIQPINKDGTLGPVLHVVCKPNGSSWVERKTAGPAAPGVTKNWLEVEARIPYESRQENDRWRGEVNIPWKAILNSAAVKDGREPAEPPALLRFNFIQHRTATGESASWSGPIDFGRDDTFMGVLYLRDPEDPRPRVVGDGSANRAVPQER